MMPCTCRKNKKARPFCSGHPIPLPPGAWKRTPKERVRLAYPTATLDNRESLRSLGLRCWFIRVGLQGEFLHYELFGTPREAWCAADDELHRPVAKRRTRKVAA